MAERKRTPTDGVTDGRAHRPFHVLGPVGDVDPRLQAQDPAGTGEVTLELPGKTLTAGQPHEPTAAPDRRQADQAETHQPTSTQQDG